MRLNMHSNTPGPAPRRAKLEAILLIFVCCLMSAPFLISAVCLFADSNLFLLGLFLLLVSALLNLAVVQMHLKEKRSYIEIDGDDITAVEYSWFRLTERRFLFSQIASAQYVPVGSPPSRPYLRIIDADDKKLFDVYWCDESLRVFSRFLADR